jgi:uncharacterized protein YndB with AHSA1/START domain
VSGFLYAVEREYPVTIEQLWNAWVDADALEDWYHPTDLSVVPGSTTSDPTVGGWWTVSVAVPAYGFNAYFFGRYTAVEPHHQLIHTMHYTQDEQEFAARDETTPHHLVQVDFEERDSDSSPTSWVRFTQFGEMPAEQIPQTKAGMESYFDSLDEYLSRAEN